VERAADPTLKLNFLSHGTLESTDLDRAREFYTEFLGLEVVRTSPISLLIRLGGPNFVDTGSHRTSIHPNINTRLGDGTVVVMAQASPSSLTNLNGSDSERTFQGIGTVEVTRTQGQVTANATQISVRATIAEWRHIGDGKDLDAAAIAELACGKQNQNGQPAVVYPAFKQVLGGPLIVPAIGNEHTF